MKHSVTEIEPRATRAWTDEGTVCLLLADERKIRFPAHKSRRLGKSTAAQLAQIELSCDGSGLHWPDSDEDLFVQGIIEGRFGT